MKIINVTKNEGKKILYTIYLDNNEKFTVSEEEYFRFSLYEEKTISIEEFRMIRDTVTFNLAKSAAVKYAARKIRTENEIYIKLLDEGFDEYIIKKVVEYLKLLNYIDDKSYVEKFLKDRIKLKPESQRMIKYKLKLKGIEDEIIEQVFNEESFDDYKLAKEIAIRRFGDKDLLNEKNKRKFYSFFTNRGYDSITISKIFNEMKKSNL